MASNAGPASRKRPLRRSASATACPPRQQGRGFAAGHAPLRGDPWQPPRTPLACKRFARTSLHAAAPPRARRCLQRGLDRWRRCATRGAPAGDRSLTCPAWLCEGDKLHGTRSSAAANRHVTFRAFSGRMTSWVPFTISTHRCCDCRAFSTGACDDWSHGVCLARTSLSCIRCNWPMPSWNCRADASGRAGSLVESAHQVRLGRERPP